MCCLATKHITCRVGGGDKGWLLYTEKMRYTGFVHTCWSVMQQAKFSSDCNERSALQAQDSVSQDQLSQLPRDQLATRSTPTGSTYHEMNSHWINLSRDELNFCNALFNGTRESWGKHQKILIMLNRFWTRNSRIPQISIVVTMLFLSTNLYMYLSNNNPVMWSKYRTDFWFLPSLLMC